MNQRVYLCTKNSEKIPATITSKESEYDMSNTESNRWSHGIWTRNLSNRYQGWGFLKGSPTSRLQTSGLPEASVCIIFIVAFYVLSANCFRGELYQQKSNSWFFRDLVTVLGLLITLSRITVLFLHVRHDSSTKPLTGHSEDMILLC